MTAIFRGKSFSHTFTITDATSGDAEDISAWTFSAQGRLKIDDELSLIDMTSGNGRLAFNTDGTDGLLDMLLTEGDTEDIFLALPDQPIAPHLKFNMIFDVIRTNGPDVFLFRAKVPLETSITRDI